MPHPKHGLGRPEKAREWLHKSAARANSIPLDGPATRLPPKLRARARTLWADRLTLEILNREAEALLRVKHPERTKDRPARADSAP
jgi:hypothetical protein